MLEYMNYKYIYINKGIFMNIFLLSDMNPIFAGPDWNAEFVYLLRIVIGGFLGLLIGLERSRRLKEAGMATHFAVGMASALLTCLSLEMEKLGSDPARIAAQIVPGVGFLGAGMIFFRRESLHGLTTAAGIWCTAAIGMVAGMGLYVLAVLATVLVIGIQLILHTKALRWKRPRVLLVKFVHSNENKESIKTYFGVKKFSRFKVYRSGDLFQCEAVIRPAQNGSAEGIANFVTTNEYILSIERLEDL